MSGLRLSKAGQVTTAGVGAGVLLVAAGWFLLVSPQHAQANSLATQTASTAQENSSLQMQLVQLRAQSKDLPAEEAALTKVEAEIPASADLATLIRQLSARAAADGVVLTSLSPGSPAALSAPSGSTHTSAGLAVGAIPVSLNASGGYFEMEQFLSDLENLPRAFLITGLSLAPDAGATTRSSTSPTGASGAVTASITATIFEAPSLAGPASAAASAG